MKKFLEKKFQHVFKKHQPKETPKPSDHDFDRDFAFRDAFELCEEINRLELENKELKDLIIKLVKEGKD